MDIYLVGGAVRDELLGYPVSERDWVVTGAVPGDLLDQGYRQVGKDFPVFLHPDTGEEYALARTERKQGHGYQGFVCNSDPSVTLEEDLSRRDLTVNAIARTEAGELIDPFGGKEDLEARILRHVSPAFLEDPLRVLRVARFAARYQHLGFRVADETLDLMTEISGSGELAYLAGERVWTEMERALGERDPGVFFTTLGQCGALARLLPELDLQPTLLEALERASHLSGDSAIRLAAMLAPGGPELAHHCNDLLKTPVRHRDLNRLCGEFLEAYCNAPGAAATDLLDLLGRVDAFRRPDRFEEFLLACRAASDLEVPAGHLRTALEACNTIQARDIARPGLKGAEIGRELHRARLRALETL